MKKSKFLSVVTGISTVILTATTTAVLAQPFELPINQDIQQLIIKLNITEDQQTELTAIRLDTRTQIEEVLAPEQQEIFRNAIAEGQPITEAITAMNLSSEQKNQIQAIFQSSRQQFRGVLTEEQRQQLRQEMFSRLARFRR
jgi:hypothetical protein